MAYAGNGSLGSTAEGRLEDVNKALSAIGNVATPVLMKLLDLNSPATNYKHEWVDKPVATLKDTIKVAQTTVTVGVLTVNGGTNTPKRYIDGVSVLRIGAEYLLVTSTVTVVTNERVLAVTRQYYSTTAASIPVGKEVWIQNPQDESFEATRNDAQFGVRKYNFTRIFERQFALSGTMQALNTPGNENTMNRQRLELTAEILKELQTAVFHGVRSESGAKRNMGGLFWYATSGGGNSVSASTLASTIITTTVFDTIIENYANAGGDVEKIMMVCSYKQQNRINALKNGRIQQMQNDNTLNNQLDMYLYNGNARVKILASTDVAEDEIFVFEEGKVKVIPLQGRTLKEEKLAKTNDADKSMLVGEYTLEARNVKETLYHYYGFAT